MAGGAGYCIDSVTFDLAIPEIPVYVEYESPICEDDDVSNGFVTESTEGEISASGDFVNARVTSTVDAGTYNRLYVQLYEGPYAVNDVLPIDDYNFGTCATCVFLLGNCDATTDACPIRYNAGDGQLVINAIDATTGEFEATITGAKFVEVVQEGAPYYDSYIPEDGAGWCIDDITVSGTLVIEDPI